MDASQLDYDAFLATCEIRLSLSGLAEQNKERVYELVQRTNQLNFSGNRYTREALAGMAADTSVVPVVMHCEDRFGAYGIVGFAILRRSGRDMELVDMMFSCRVQGKKVEHSFLAHVSRCAAQAGFARYVCLFNRTQRNAPAAAVFNDLGFVLEPREGEGGKERYVMSLPAVLKGAFPVAIEDGLNLVRRLAHGTMA